LPSQARSLPASRQSAFLMAVFTVDLLVLRRGLDQRHVGRRPHLGAAVRCRDRLCRDHERWHGAAAFVQGTSAPPLRACWSSNELRYVRSSNPE
jgi:hypothetical protein